jgi:hypothetical protein
VQGNKCPLQQGIVQGTGTFETHTLRGGIFTMHVSASLLIHTRPRRYIHVPTKHTSGLHPNYKTIPDWFYFRAPQETHRGGIYMHTPPHISGCFYACVPNASPYLLADQRPPPKYPLQNVFLPPPRVGTCIHLYTFYEWTGPPQDQRATR